MMKIYNTYSKKKELITNDLVKIYTCGITVYDYCHIGHARLFIIFDTLIRYLNYKKKKIIFIRNITDIDDKIIKRAKEKKIFTQKLTNYFIKKMHSDTKKLNIIEPTYEPKATEFISEMINLIKIIKKKKFTYKNKKSSIYFKTTQYKHYGALSNQKLKEPYKNYTTNRNFVLWKNFKKNENIFWESPWGKGRPGWHTECSTMIMYYANSIDIHGGGQDLLFPHHENELTQCELINGKNFIKIWMHVGQLKINKKKMSKTLGNHILIKNLLQNFNEECLRLLILSTNYKKNINFTKKNLLIAQKTLEKLYKIKKTVQNIELKINPFIEKSFTDALNDNLNTQKAISVLFKFIKDNNSTENIYTVIELFKHLGLLKYTELNKKNHTLFDIEKIKQLIKIRNDARQNKNWILADKIRKNLIKFNIKIKDFKNNTIFELN